MDFPTLGGVSKQNHHLTVNDSIMNLWQTLIPIKTFSTHMAKKSFRSYEFNLLLIISQLHREFPLGYLKFCIRGKYFLSAYKG